MWRNFNSNTSLPQDIVGKQTSNAVEDNEPPKDQRTDSNSDDRMSEDFQNANQGGAPPSGNVPRSSAALLRQRIAAKVQAEELTPEDIFMGDAKLWLGSAEAQLRSRQAEEVRYNLTESQEPLRVVQSETSAKTVVMEHKLAETDETKVQYERKMNDNQLKPNTLLKCFMNFDSQREKKPVLKLTEIQRKFTKTRDFGSKDQEPLMTEKLTIRSDEQVVKKLSSSNQLENEETKEIGSESNERVNQNIVGRFASTIPPQSNSSGIQKQIKNRMLFDSLRVIAKNMAGIKASAKPKPIISHEQEIIKKQEDDEECEEDYMSFSAASMRSAVEEIKQNVAPYSLRKQDEFEEKSTEYSWKTSSARQSKKSIKTSYVRDRTMDEAELCGSGRSVSKSSEGMEFKDLRDSWSFMDSTKSDRKVLMSSTSSKKELCRESELVFVKNSNSSLGKRGCGSSKQELGAGSSKSSLKNRKRSTATEGRPLGENKSCGISQISSKCRSKVSDYRSTVTTNQDADNSCSPLKESLHTTNGEENMERRERGDGPEENPEEAITFRSRVVAWVKEYTIVAIMLILFDIAINPEAFDLPPWTSYF